MKAIVRIATPTVGTAGEILDRQDDSVLIVGKYEELYGGVNSDYELIAVPSGETTLASEASLDRSSYSHATSIFTWIPMSQKEDYLNITTTSTASPDGHYEVLGDGADSIIIAIQKKSGVDDSNMVSSTDNEKLLINSVHGVNIIEGLTPVLVNGTKSITIKSSLQLTTCPISVKFYDNSLVESSELLLRFT